MRRIFSIAMVMTLLVAAVGPATVLAAAPSNDNFGSAEAVSTFPYADPADLTDATTEPGEPQACFGLPRTLWYSVTAPAHGSLIVRARYDAGLVIYMATSMDFAGLVALRCGAFVDRVEVEVEAGTTYYVQVGSVWGIGGPADLTIEFLPPPANDNFASATVIAALPFTDATTTGASSLESGEPMPSCYFGPRYGSIWYAFTATETASVTATVFSSQFSDVTIREGTSLDSLAELACRHSPATATIQVQAGFTYYVQVTAIGGVGPTTVSLDLASPPIAAFAATSNDPSTFDTVAFFDQSYDPGNAGIEMRTWDFGDGSTATGHSAEHRYGTDGDYPVTLTVTTVDGRLASTTRTFQVRTHDVAITKFAVPNSASANQTRSITVGLSNRRYPETVTVILWKLTPAGTVQVGVSTNAVPVRSGNRTTDFVFSYTFTTDDAKAGKVTFRAEAILVDGARDAVWGDNLAHSLPTKVNK
jgi:PKD repeat protein